eukprot:gnl/Hemi2/17254_TR5751_c0_g1_i1.p1 gnl/Hemi2/17254_TR5751_c0_g1~~gnl/Hemi2/17254_TR5751_c0_g1_i1.p1  ORF type:complete len:475 (-),score=49.14 gnl/Hemi2/17254_TR5751_c0_g1_i1:62-1486(-)
MHRSGAPPAKRQKVQPQSTDSLDFSLLISAPTAPTAPPSAVVALAPAPSPSLDLSTLTPKALPRRASGLPKPVAPEKALLNLSLLLSNSLEKHPVPVLPPRAPSPPPAVIHHHPVRAPEAPEPTKLFAPNGWEDFFGSAGAVPSAKKWLASSDSRGSPLMLIGPPACGKRTFCSLLFGGQSTLTLGFVDTTDHGEGLERALLSHVSLKRRPAAVILEDLELFAEDPEFVSRFERLLKLKHFAIPFVILCLDLSNAFVRRQALLCTQIKLYRLSEKQLSALAKRALARWHAPCFSSDVLQRLCMFSNGAPGVLVAALDRHLRIYMSGRRDAFVGADQSTGDLFAAFQLCFEGPVSGLDSSMVDMVSENIRLRPGQLELSHLVELTDALSLADDTRACFWRGDGDSASETCPETQLAPSLAVLAARVFYEKPQRRPGAEPLRFPTSLKFRARRVKLSLLEEQGFAKLIGKSSSVSE